MGGNRSNFDPMQMAQVHKQTGQYLLPHTDVSGATYTVEDGDVYLAVKYTTTGTVAVTLPAASSHRVGRMVRVKDCNGNAGTNNIVISCAGGETIDGAASYTMNSDFESVDLHWDGSAWYVS